MRDTGDVIEFEVKEVAEDGTFTGYASTFNNPDLGGDIVLPGAFTKSLSKRPADKVKMLRGHDQSEPIGVWTDLAEDKKGLRASGKLIMETAKGWETYVLMKAGAMDGLSIGFRAIKSTFDRAKGARLLQELDVPEISVVTFPMNTRATVSAVKSEQADARARAIVSAINRAKEALLAQ